MRSIYAIYFSPNKEKMKKFVDEREVIMQAYTKDKEVLDFGV